MISLLLLLTTAASPPPSEESRSVAGIFSMDDYPPEALKNGWEGDVVIKVRVGTDGKAHSCRIVRSSGHQVLDNYTCAIVFGRARFIPARDRLNHEVEDDFVLPPVRWRIENQPPPPPVNR